MSQTNITTNTNASAATTAQTVIDDGVFMFPVETAKLDRFESLRGKLCAASYPAFCSAVPCSMTAQVGSKEMIEECQRLIDSGVEVREI